jgi:hypothetical protein
MGTCPVGHGARHRPPERNDRGGVQGAALSPGPLWLLGTTCDNSAMPNLRKFTLAHDSKKDGWKLEDASGRVVRRFDTKAAATKGGVLKKALGS